ncbi:MAG TPA: N-acetylmuramidase domain-containing protein [Noviherbaspirillum sp.]|nr:N-acetylmuramidase domain-containing protein [Noviherbaspirillum sp.]
MTGQRNFYIVKDRDTLAKIARENGTTVSELMKINGIKDPNKIARDQRIALRKEATCGVQALFLDTDRAPIEGLNYRIEYCNKTSNGRSGKDGKSHRIYTETPEDFVRIRIQRLNGTWKHAATVISDTGNKLVTLVGGHLMVEAKAEKHPESPDKKAPNPYERPTPAHSPAKPPPPTSDKKDFGPKTKKSSTSDGKPITIVLGDLPGLDEFLDKFNGEKMSDADYVWAAKELNVEEAAVRAFAKVESGSGGFIEISGRELPKILYERHYFSKLTQHQHSAKNPDISLPTGYYVAGTKYVLADSDYKKKRNVPQEVQYYRPINKKDSQQVKESAIELQQMLQSGVATAEKDKYLAGVLSYKRLCKAYQLSKPAALESCSWGAFQIMGSNWKQMGYASVHDFTKAISRSEKEQIKAFVLFIKKVKPAIADALRKLDWDTVARLYNGTTYKQNQYDIKLEAAYQKFKKEK